MHPFPCSALLTCFGSVRESAHFDQTEPHGLSAEGRKAETTSTIRGQPSAKDTKREEAGVTVCHYSCCTEAHSISETAHCNSRHHAVAQSVFTAADSSAEGMGCNTLTIRTHIPRPSIIGVPKVSAGKCCYGHGSGKWLFNKPKCTLQKKVIHNSY